MEDETIIALYFARSEEAIRETDRKHGPACRAVASSILCSREDAEECVSDTYLAAWNAMPPQRPQKLRAFLTRITRNLSLDRYRSLHAEKRGFGQTELALSELEGCIPSPDPAAKLIDDLALTEVLNRFLAGLKPEKRRIFLRRYWYLSSVKEIAEDFGISESKVKMTLLRTRNELKARLEKEGFAL